MTQMTHSRPYFGRNMVVFLGLNGGGGGAPAAPPSRSATVKGSFGHILKGVMFFK